MNDKIPRSRLTLEDRLNEAMDKLDKHHPQIAGRLRTIWRREDEAWIRGEPPPTDLERGAVLGDIEPEQYLEPEHMRVGTGAPQPEYLRPTVWERWRGYWHRF